MKIKLVSLLLFLLFAGCGKKTTDLQTINGFTMGTTYSVKILPGGNESTLNTTEIKKNIDSLLTEVNRQMSTYIPESEISSFNNSKIIEWQKVSEDFALVVKEAKRIGYVTGGALNVTLGPLVNLWGFGPESRPVKIPTEEEISNRKQLTGLELLEVDSTNTSIKKSIPQLYCDLSSIAKGFGVDKVAEYLSSIAIVDFMVEIGGEVRTMGNNHLGQPWQIGISTPDENFGLQKVVSLSGLSMATSGDYRNYFEEDGIRFSHMIDPQTGKPITHKLVSVTVIHNSCMTADGFATAILVLGPDRGFDLALKEKMSVFLIVKEKDGFVEKTTPEFKKYLSTLNVN